MIKNILVTGGTRGIGLEFARQYLMKGQRVFVASRRPERSEQVKQLKVEFDNRLSIHRLDISEGRSRQQLFDVVLRKRASGTSRIG